MRADEKKRLLSLAYLSPLIGILIGSVYLAIKQCFNISIGFRSMEGLATVIAGFSFTMLGFLAAVAAFMFSLQRYSFFRRWVNDGGSDVFFALYKVSIVCLFVTFSLSVIVFTKNGSDLAFKFMLMSVINNVFQTLIVTMIIVGQISKAKKEDV